MRMFGGGTGVRFHLRDPLPLPDGCSTYFVVFGGDESGAYQCSDPATARIRDKQTGQVIRMCPGHADTTVEGSSDRWYRLADA